MIILKTESQLKSFIHRHSCKPIDDDDKQFYWDDHFSMHWYRIIVDGKKVIKHHFRTEQWGNESYEHFEVVALYLPRGKSQGSQP